MFQKDLLQAKRILITGGGTGLGKAAAQRFLELGAEVYLCGRRQDVLAATEQELHERTGGSRDHKKIHTLPCDVRDAAAVEELIGAIWAEGPLDVLMNNAAGNFLSRTEDLSLGAFQSVIGIVLLARCTRRWRADGAGWPKAGEVLCSTSRPPTRRRARPTLCRRRWRRRACMPLRAVWPSNGGIAGFG